MNNEHLKVVCALDNKIVVSDYIILKVQITFIPVSLEIKIHIYKIIFSLCFIVSSHDL